MANLRPTATEVVPFPNYEVLLRFDNGEVKVFDVSPYIEGNWYGKIGNPDYFKTVHCDGFTIAWQDGQDICPDDVYYNSTPFEGEF